MLVNDRLDICLKKTNLRAVDDNRPVSALLLPLLDGIQQVQEYSRVAGQRRIVTPGEIELGLFSRCRPTNEMNNNIVAYNWRFRHNCA